MQQRRRGLAAIAIVILSLGLTACSSEADELADQYRDGSGKGYITASGVVTEFPAGERSEPISFSGPLDIGGTASADQFRGQVLVVNFWYAGCPPCRVEAEHLEAVYEELGGDDVAFLGVNVRDEAATALSFAEAFQVTYPSILDARDAQAQLAFAATVPPNAIPTTLVLDREGRIAARILGMIDSPSILRTIVKDLVAEPGSGS